MVEIVLASSRGRGLKRLMAERHQNPDNLIHIYYKGATYEDLLKHLRTLWLMLEKPERDGARVYFMAGLCNLTHMERRGRYQETTFMDDPDIAVTRVMRSIQAVSDATKELGAKPIFCTVVPSSIREWNLHRLRVGCTAYLRHQDRYPLMQHNLLQATITLNKHITRHNMTNTVHTPKIADTVIHNKGKGKNKRVQYSKLVDGVHPDEALKRAWAIKLTSSMARH